MEKAPTVKKRTRTNIAVSLLAALGLGACSESSSQPSANQDTLFATTRQTMIDMAGTVITLASQQPADMRILTPGAVDIKIPASAGRTILIHEASSTNSGNLPNPTTVNALVACVMLTTNPAWICPKDDKGKLNVTTTEFFQDPDNGTFMNYDTVLANSGSVYSCSFAPEDKQFGEEADFFKKLVDSKSVSAPPIPPDVYNENCL